MTVATLGIELAGIPGFDRGAAALEKFTAASRKAEMASAGLTAKADAAAARVGQVFKADTHAARFAQMIDKSSRSLSGFEGIAARAGAEAAYLAKQMEQVSGRDIRNNDIQEFGREMDQLRAKFNPLFAASKAYEGELDEINRAHKLGAISAMEKGAAIMRLDARYEAAARAANRLSAANRSMASSFHTTNLMFQAQDIAMMSMMGQAPLAVALQQGMQVGGIFHQIGNGRQVVQALGGALTGLLSPINLVTIGAIALGAAGVQAFMSWVSSMGPVERSMEDHQKWLGEILKGYDDINKAVNDYLDTATRMPATLLRIDLGEQMTQVQAQLDSLRSGIEEFGLSYGSALPFGPFQQFNQDIEILRQLRDEYVAGASDAETFAGSLRSITSNNNVSPFVRELAQNLYDMVRDAADAEAQLGSLEIAMDRAGQAAQLAAQRTQMLNDTFAMLGNGAGQHGGLQNVMDEGVAALDSLRRMVPEIRSTKEIAGDLVQTVLDTLPTGAARQEAEALFNTIIENEAILNARREANRVAGRKERDPYGDLTRGAMEFIAAQQLEQQALGMTTEAAQRLRYEQQLLNQAANDNIKLTPAMRSELMGLAAQMASVEEATRRVTEMYNFGREVFTGMFSDLKSGLRDGQNMWEALGNTAANALDKIADRALSMAANGIFDMIFGAFMGGIGGGFGMGGGMRGISSITGSSGGFFPGFASGTNYAPGGLAWVGERGPELVNLPRGSQVYDHQRSMAMVANGNSLSVVRIELGPELEGRVLTQAAGQTIQIVAASQPDTVQKSTAAAGKALAGGDYRRGMATYGLQQQAKRR